MDDRKILLQQVSFCVGLPEVAITALAAIAVPLQRRAGAIIQIEGEPAEAMYVVTQGRVKVVRIGAQGREQVLLIATAGHHFNSVPMFDGGPCPANAEALTDVSLLALPRVPLNRVVEEHPQLALAFLKEFTSRLRHVVNLVDELALHTVQGRLAHLLLTQAEAAERGEVVAPLTQAQIAAQLGTVREMISRTLKGFEVLGLIRLDRGMITVLDRNGLLLQSEQ